MLVVGVGGQGVLTAARLAGEAARLSGQDAVMGQLHGMSQRGGSVEATLLMGAGQTSFVPPGGADLVLALEPLEALRAARHLSPKTTVIVERTPVVPFTLGQKGQGYPPIDDILGELAHRCGRVVVLDAMPGVREVADPRCLNIACLGAVDGLGAMPVDPGALWSAVEQGTVPASHGANRRAFELGQQLVSA